ncbi:hypothetical protein LIER_43787 [Lithospermum erythrorhizon]|uniref:CASP-like protein n=1 Tax=Lithospermum erythrorhizon TaxID=34254 RepID=A0AAV3QWI4_LITER
MGILGNNIPILQVLDCCLRLFAVPFSIASFWLTLTNQQKNRDYGDIKFSNFTGLKYLAIISAIAAGYAIVGAVCLWIKVIVSKAWLFFVSDQVCFFPRTRLIRLCTMMVLKGGLIC